MNCNWHKHKSGGSNLSLKDKDIEERERQNRGKNIIVFGLPESDKPKPETRREARYPEDGRIMQKHL